MSVLVYTESENGAFKKTAYEVASYAKGIADMLGTDVAAISFHAADAGELGTYGVSKLHNVKDAKLDKFNAGAYADAIAQAAKEVDAKSCCATSVVEVSRGFTVLTKSSDCSSFPKTNNSLVKFLMV